MGTVLSSQELGGKPGGDGIESLGGRVLGVTPRYRPPSDPRKLKKSGNERPKGGFRLEEGLFWYRTKNKSELRLEARTSKTENYPSSGTLLGKVHLILQCISIFILNQFLNKLCRTYIPTHIHTHVYIFFFLLFHSMQI